MKIFIVICIAALAICQNPPPKPPKEGKKIFTSKYLHISIEDFPFRIQPKPQIFRYSSLRLQSMLPSNLNE